MRKKRKDIDTANTGRMTDAALSKNWGAVSSLRISVSCWASSC